MTEVHVNADATSEPVRRNDLSIRVRSDTVEEAKELVKQASLVSQKGGDLTPRGSDEPQNQLELLLEELGKLEVQQNKLRDAVKHNKGIVVHPRQEALQEEEDADTPKAASPKAIVVSGGLTGFGIAKDLLKIDFSTPEEAPEEYRAVAFYEEPRTLKPGGPSGSFGLCDPASKEMHEYLVRLEEQQKAVLEMITGKKQELIDKYSSKGALQDGKAKRPKSRLSKSNTTKRLTATEDKEAVSDALGIPKQGGRAQGKGLLANKIPVPVDQIIAAQQSTPTIVNQALITTPTAPSSKPSTSLPPIVHKQRPVFQQPYKVAQVQKSDEAKKEHEEIVSEFAVAMPGTTPSTQHLAYKKKPTANTEEDSAEPYYSGSPQAQPRPLKSTLKPTMRRANWSTKPEEGDSNGETKAKKGFLGGLKKKLLNRQ